MDDLQINEQELLEENDILQKIEQIGSTVKLLREENNSLEKSNEALNIEMEEKNSIIARLYYSIEQLNEKIDYLSKANSDFVKDSEDIRNNYDDFLKEKEKLEAELLNAKNEIKELNAHNKANESDLTNLKFIQKEMLDRKKENLEKDKLIEMLKEKISVLENKNFGTLNDAGTFETKYEEFIANIYNEIFILRDKISALQKVIKHNNELSNLLLQQVANSGMETYQLQMPSLNIPTDRLHDTLIRERNKIDLKFEEFQQNIKNITKSIELVQDEEQKERNLLTIIEEKYHRDRSRVQENKELREKIRKLNELSEQEKHKLREALRKANENIEQIEEQNRSLNWKLNQLKTEYIELDEEFKNTKIQSTKEIQNEKIISEIKELRRRNDNLQSKFEELKMLTRRTDREGLKADLIECYIELDKLNQELELIKKNNKLNNYQKEPVLYIDRKKAADLVTRIELFIDKMSN